MQKVFTIHKAKTNFSKLVKQAQAEKIPLVTANQQLLTSPYTTIDARK